ncbi:MAG: DUF4124 domain-containing protein [Gammaproteobacteria bacterium]|nr:DUF4124 domain-containing protein [Gammaproteobacteria bacterium]
MARLFLLSILSLAAAAAGADIYKWVDGDNVHYSDKPPAVAAEKIDIESQRTDPERIASLNAPADDAATAGMVVADEAERERLEAEREAKRRSNCDIAKRSMASLMSATRIYEPMPDGERRYLSEDEVEQRKSTAQADVDKWCNSTS